MAPLSSITLAGVKMKVASPLLNVKGSRNMFALERSSGYLVTAQRLNLWLLKSRARVSLTYTRKSLSVWTRKIFSCMATTTLTKPRSLTSNWSSARGERTAKVRQKSLSSLLTNSFWSCTIKFDLTRVVSARTQLSMRAEYFGRRSILRCAQRFHSNYKRLSFSCKMSLPIWTIWLNWQMKESLYSTGLRPSPSKRTKMSSLILLSRWTSASGSLQELATPFWIGFRTLEVYKAC